MAGRYNANHLKAFHDVFNLYDKNHKGTIHVNHLPQCLRLLGQNPPQDYIQICLKQSGFDTAISFEKLLYVYWALAKASRHTNKPSDIVAALQILDTERTGYISAVQLRYLLTKFEEKLSNEEIDQLFEGKVDKDGNIKYSEFIQTLASN